MDNKSTTKRMIGAVVLVLIAALLLAWLLKGKNRGMEEKNLIAEQTQDASPILGFPGVNTDGANVADGGVAANGTADGATQEGANQDYVIGATANPDDAAQQQAQNALGGQMVQGVADAGSTVTGAVSGAVTAGTEAVKGLASQLNTDTTGFQVRDSNGEVRQVVEGGQAVDGVGSMGADVKTAAKATDTAAQQTAGASAAADGKAAGKAAGATASASSAGKTGGSDQQQVNVSGGELKAAAKTGANLKLVNERPVPPPAEVSSRSSAAAPAASSSVATSSSASAASSGSSAAATGRSGYVIQVLATSDKGKADGVRKSISVDGYPAFVASAKVDGKTVYRVRVGTYPGKGDAAAVQSRMKARYSQNQYVQNSFVTQN